MSYWGLEGCVWVTAWLKGAAIQEMSACFRSTQREDTYRTFRKLRWSRVNAIARDPAAAAQGEVYASGAAGTVTKNMVAIHESLLIGRGVN